MSSLNRVMLIGNVGRDPETRNTPGGEKIVNLSIATSEKWTDKHSGDKQERTEWHRVAVFGPLADIAERYLAKGSRVYLAGQLRTRKWQDNGQDRYSTEVILSGPRAEIVLLGGKGDNDDAERPTRNAERGEATRRRDGKGYDDLDDTIPF